MSALFSTAQETCRQQLCELRKPQCLDVIYSHRELSLEAQVVHAHEVVCFGLVDLSAGLQRADQGANVDLVSWKVQVCFRDELANRQLKLFPSVDNDEMGMVRSSGIKHRRFAREGRRGESFIRWLSSERGHAGPGLPAEPSAAGGKAAGTVAELSTIRASTLSSSRLNSAEKPPGKFIFEMSAMRFLISFRKVKTMAVVTAGHATALVMLETN